ncbi:DUF1189 domain-containing protein [Bacillus sp. CGMCC 1.16607]|uniref:DUF1189 domain-containing protein n=1 Tax=Bacillus sp. CGMCC 1.16607 TaxID=3351842 RepID=UPI00363285A1
MNLFNQFIKSLYSPKDIAKFRFQGIGKTILYVFFLSFLSLIPSAYYFSAAIVNGLEVTKNTFENEVPTFVIKDGQLSLDSKTPVTIEKDDFNIILDSTGSLQADDIGDSENAIALLKNEFVFAAGGQVQTYNYALFSDMKLANKDIVSFIHSMDNLKMIFLPILILVMYIFSSGLKFIGISIYAAVGIFLAKLLQKNVPYRQLWRMAAYSVTIPTIFFAIMVALQTTVPNGFLINWLVSIMVLMLALKEIPVKKQK